MEETLFEKYQKEIEEDLKLDDFNLKDTQMRLPTTKHKWVARLIQQKIEKQKLKDLRMKAVSALFQKACESEPVKLSDKVLLQHVENNDVIKKIDRSIQECETLIIYLEKIETICRSITFDVKNIIEIKKLELT